MSSPVRPPRALFARALAQTCALWVVFLLLVPVLILSLEARFGMERFSIGTWRYAVSAVFSVAGPIGFYCGWLFAAHGRGTPYPRQQPHRLVVKGPYRYIRNPMAALGILQGVAVGMYFGSVLTILYALLGGLLWNLIARPMEEADLGKRFGSAFEEYRRNVRCWVPRLSAYRPPESADE